FGDRLGRLGAFESGGFAHRLLVALAVAAAPPAPAAAPPALLRAILAFGRVGGWRDLLAGFVCFRDFARVRHVLALLVVLVPAAAAAAAAAATALATAILVVAARFVAVVLGYVVFRQLVVAVILDDGLELRRGGRARAGAGDAHLGAF